MPDLRYKTLIRVPCTAVSIVKDLTSVLVSRTVEVMFFRLVVSSVVLAMPSSLIVWRVDCMSSVCCSFLTALATAASITELMSVIL